MTNALQLLAKVEERDKRRFETTKYYFEATQVPDNYPLVSISFIVVTAIHFIHRKPL